MHFLTLVVVPAGLDREAAEAAVEERLTPYRDDYDEATDTSSGWWDWWTIGGRHTGYLSEYDPAQDARNIKECDLCRGTGIRPGGLEQFGQTWFDWCKGCNGCEGTGKTVVWPTSWVPHPFDVSSVKVFLMVADRLPYQPYRIVTPDGVAEKETWDGEHFVQNDDYDPATVLEPWASEGLVVVDVHD